VGRAVGPRRKRPATPDAAAKAPFGKSPPYVYLFPPMALTVVSTAARLAPAVKLMSMTCTPRSLIIAPWASRKRIRADSAMAWGRS
jgi:hypothetical protein